MLAITTTATEMRASLRRRARRAPDADGDSSPSSPAVALRRRLFVSGTSGARAFRGRAVAVAVGGPGSTRYLVADADRGELWVDERDIARCTPLGPGDTVIGYVTERDGGRPGATRAARASIRRACEREGWRLVGVVCDDERSPVSARPGLRGALERIGAGAAAGLVVPDLAEATGSDAGLAALMAAVRRAGGGVAALRDDDLATTAEGRPARLPAARARIAELRAGGMAPRAIADVLNAEGVPTRGPDRLWRPWSVRDAGGAWPPRGPERPRARP
jgi:hypothetical protein